ncbi:hypothetical protein [Corynebacterium stationis]|uniref:hypothetical protein n=1 Tax=Corynebacterium stationis TaxID=1705 RepID=UPI002602D838|nr:hypothetical protein [Corynebacterium stationis]
MALTQYSHTIPATEVQAIIMAPTTPAPKFAYQDGERTEGIDQHADGWDIHQLRDIPVKIGNTSAIATIQLADVDEIDAGSIIRPNDDAEVRVRGRSATNSTFVELTVTVVAESWEVVGDVAEALTAASTTY